MLQSVFIALGLVSNKIELIRKTKVGRQKLVVISSLIVRASDELLCRRDQLSAATTGDRSPGSNAPERTIAKAVFPPTRFDPWDRTLFFREGYGTALIITASV